MTTEFHGRLLAGDPELARRSYAAWAAQAVDLERVDESEAGDFEAYQTTLARETSATGQGTYLRRARRTLTFRPSGAEGWWFDRADLPDSLPIGVTVQNVWTTVRNVVLRSGSPHNYMRMVEHIVALRVGMGLDNLVIAMDSGDPPLFDRSSLDLVEAVEEAGIVVRDAPVVHLTVKEPVTVVGDRGSFLTFLPPENGSRRLFVDCAVDFRNAIGKQRIRFWVGPRTFRHGAFARTNTTFWTMLYCRTIGKIFADVRNLGYTLRNILVAGPRRYINRPRMMHDGKSLEAVWHRATLDLLAGPALIDRGRFVGRIISYKAGHTLDVQMIRELYRHDLLEEV